MFFFIFQCFWATVCKTVRPMLSDRCPFPVVVHADSAFQCSSASCDSFVDDVVASCGIPVEDILST